MKRKITRKDEASAEAEDVSNQIPAPIQPAPVPQEGPKGPEPVGSSVTALEPQGGVSTSPAPEKPVQSKPDGFTGLVREEVIVKPWSAMGIRMYKGGFVLGNGLKAKRVKLASGTELVVKITSRPYVKAIKNPPADKMLISAPVEK